MHDEFPTPAAVLAAPKERGVSGAALATAFRAAMGGSWLSMIRWLIENAPAIIRLLDEIFGQQEAISRDLGGKPDSRATGKAEGRAK